VLRYARHSTDHPPASCHAIQEAAWLVKIAEAQQAKYIWPAHRILACFATNKKYASNRPAEMLIYLMRYDNMIADSIAV
jgi:hypothetical protein